MLVNGRWLAAHPDQYQKQMPLVGARWKTGGGYTWAQFEHWDEFRPMVIGQHLTRFCCGKRECELVIGEAALQILDDPTTRPIFDGAKEPRVLPRGEDLRTAWVLAREAYFFY